MGKRGRLVLGLIAVTTHAALLFVYWTPQPKLLAGDEGMYLAAAQRLLRGQPAGLDLVWPPLYPHFVATSLWLGQGSLWGLHAAQTLLLVLFAVLLREVARGLLGPGAAPDLVGFFAVAYPPLAAFSHYLWPEVLHLFLVAVMLWILCYRRSAPGWLALLGVALGLALQTKGILQGFFPVLLVPLAWRGVGSPGSRLRRVGLVLALAGLCVAPSVVSNWNRHRMLVIAEPVLFNLWVGLNDRGVTSFADPVVEGAYIEYTRSAPDSLQRRRLLLRKTAALVRERGLHRILSERIALQYRRLFHRDSFLTDQLPGGDLAEADRPQGYRRAASGLTSALRWLSYAWYGALLAVATCAMALYAPGRGWLRIALAFVAYNLVILLFLHVKSRYRIQLLPVFFLCAGLAVDRWWRWRHGQPVEQLSSTRWLFAAAAVAGVSCLAYL
jgi:hypothetical protein